MCLFNDAKHTEGVWHLNKEKQGIPQVPPDLMNFNTPHQFNVYTIEQESTPKVQPGKETLCT